ncbi:Lectin-receptor kinase [Melia azedarach]|uniref:Lectin-receptor kinase n=1 Tax=Melia azedarach TaxID=155640 RepID=A0ACC1YQE6_MELAZ|nr:Lectin-receptor kinase [Melia azedarach]
MGAALRSVYFCILFCISLISFALARDADQFIYHRFYEHPQLHRDGFSSVHSNGLLQLTNTVRGQQVGHAFYPFPLKFNTCSSQTFSFSTNFVFAIIPEFLSFGGQGMAFVLSPTISLSKREAFPSAYLGLFNFSNNGQSTKHILAIELDTVKNFDFNDIDNNHVGIDVNSLISNESASAAYFSNKEGMNKNLKLMSGDPIQIWIDYRGDEKLPNVTIAPIKIPKPNRPLLSTHIDLSRILLETMYVDFSASTGSLKSNHYILGWSFNKSGQAINLDISSLPRLPVLSSPPTKETDKPQPRLVIFIFLVSLVIVLITIGAAVYIVRQKKYEEIYENREREYGPQRFTSRNLYKATKGFKEKEVIGKGGFGKVYRGVLPSNVQVAVKRVSHDSEQGMKEFVAEVVSMRRLRHKNLVKLLGYCRRKGEFLLVYDYMPNGSLDKILYCNTNLNLNSFQRFHIIRGVSSGLLNLHEDWEQVVLHRDIKPANVLLDNDMNGRLGDFGLARLYDHGSTPQTTRLVGTFGYMAPELMKMGMASTSTDVYAFGVFMLEVACGRRPIGPQGLATVILVDWVADCWKRGAIVHASDPRLGGLYAEEQMELVLKLGILFSHPNPAARPSMRQVIQYLDGGVIPLEVVVVDLVTAINEVSDSEILVPSVTRSSIVHTMSAIDSILMAGR